MMHKLPKRERLQLVRRMVNSHKANHKYNVIADLCNVNPGQITKDVKELRSRGLLVE